MLPALGMPRRTCAGGPKASACCPHPGVRKATFRVQGFGISGRTSGLPVLGLVFRAQDLGFRGE